MLYTYNILYLVSKMECPYCGDSKSKVTNKHKTKKQAHSSREQKALKLLSKLRDNLEEVMFKDYPKQATTEIYYGGR